MIIITDKQWTAFNRFTASLHDKYSHEHFYQCCVEDFTSLLGVNWMSLSINNKHLQMQDLKVTSSYEEAVRGYTRAIDQTVASHPVVNHLQLWKQTKEVRGIYITSDFVSERQLKELAIYRDALRYIDAEYQMVAEINFTSELRTMLTISSENPISVEQHLLTEMVVPHLILAYQNVLKYSQPEIYLPMNDPRHELLDQLSPRLQEVVKLLISGLSRKMIADRLDLSLHTVNGYIKEVYAKFKLHSHAELLVLFTASAPVPPSP